MDVPDFPKGFESWQRTHFEVVEVLVYMRSLEENKKRLKGFAGMLDQSASDEMYHLALYLTNKYEEQTVGKETTRNLFDEIEDFVWSEIKSSENIR